MRFSSIRRIRRNHALEHATIAVLLEQGARPPLGGYSTSGGFFIFGSEPTDRVTQAAEQALARLAGGEGELGISPYCGTNLVTGALLSGILSALIMGRGRHRMRRVPHLAVAVLGATIVSRPLGRALQRHFTTLADMNGMEIAGVRRFRVGSFTIHRFGTIQGRA